MTIEYQTIKPNELKEAAKAENKEHLLTEGCCFLLDRVGQMVYVSSKPKKKAIALFKRPYRYQSNAEDAA